MLNASIKQKIKFVTIIHHEYFCNTKLSAMRNYALQPNSRRNFSGVSAIQGKVDVMLKKFVMQSLQDCHCDKLFSLHSESVCCTTGCKPPTNAGGFYEK